MKKSWFSVVKRIFVSDKNEKRKRWVFGGFKVKRLTSLPAPPRSIEQNQISESVYRVEKITESCSIVSVEESAATTIQTTFRGYLARKALQALKGIVKLQALIRGRAVRRQSVTTLKYLQSIINIQTQACAARFQTSLNNKQCHFLGDKSKKNAQALILNNKEGAMKSERIVMRCFHKSAESERKKWIDTQVSKDLDTIRSSRRYSEEFGEKSIPRSPTYMGATQSARAKVRSVSSDTCSHVKAYSRFCKINQNCKRFQL